MNLHGLQLLPTLLLLASQVSGTVVVQNATYDDRTFVPTLDIPVGTYKNLIYNAWILAGPTAGNLAVGGVANQSPQLGILSAVDTQLTNGTPTFTVAKPYKYFSLLDFYFGCVVRTDEAALGVASQCTITVAGFKANTNQEVSIALYTFTPSPKPLTPVPMIHAVLPSTFAKSLYNVTIVQDNELLALKIDNLHYSLST